MARARPPDERFTAISCHLLRWKRFRGLPSDSILLWIVLYTGEQAKKTVPGLFTGSVYTMADDSNMQPSEADRALCKLIDHGLVQYDLENRIARLTELPDTLDRPTNDRALSGWWTRFRTVPGVPIRDAHVPLLHWLATAEIERLIGIGKQQGADAMSRVWRQTFETISVPQTLPRYVSPSSSDTGTTTQPSLFGPPPKIELNKNSYSRPLPGPCQGSGRGPDQDQDLDQVIPEGGGEEDPDGAPQARHLKLVPDTTDPDAERRRAYVNEMREAVRAAGGGHLVRSDEP